MAHHYSMVISQAIAGLYADNTIFWTLPDVTHFRSPFYGHACWSAQRAIDNIYRSLRVPATGIRLRHEYAKHAFYDTWTQVHRRLFYNPRSFDAPPQGTLANIPNVPYISRN